MIIVQYDRKRAMDCLRSIILGINERRKTTTKTHTYTHILKYKKYMKAEHD